MRGIFITFEGPDGSGKTTQINRLKACLEEKGYSVVVTREPGGTLISEKIRSIVLDPENEDMNSVCEALLYAASRAQLVYEVIIPSLNEGKIVIADRFVDSSVVYQGYARGLGQEIIEGINKYAVLGQEPDITFLITLPPEVGISRKNNDGKLDRLEQENILFHKKVLEGYNNIKEKFERIVHIDGTLDIDEIQEIIRNRIGNILKL